MPIKDLSDVRRMPRLGKIRLGIKVEPEEEGKNPYPRATDYFVVPDEIKKLVGNTPKTLNIMFPTEKPDEFAQQWLRCYSFTQGLICISDDTEILTNRGWLGIEELREGDLAVTMDLATGAYIEQLVEQKQVFDYQGDLLNFRTRSLNALLTPDHRVIYRRQRGHPWRTNTADQVPTHVSWPAVGPLNKTDMQIPDDLLSLLGWVIPEGTKMKASWARSHRYPATGTNRLSPEEREARASYILISQCKPQYVKEIRELLQRYSGRVCESTSKNVGGPQNRNQDVYPRTNFFLGRQETDICRSFLGDLIHRIPRVILAEASPRQLGILFDTMMKANGSQDKKHGLRYYAGKNKGQADDFQELCTRLGRRAAINPGSQNPSTVGQFWVHISPWKRSHTIKHRPQKIAYQGRVWCITIPNGSFVARRSGRVFTTGNCKGDGSTAVRKVDVETGDIARHTTQEWVFKDWGCDPDTCEQYSEKQCRRVMNLLFFIPDVPGLGVWQLDTTSFYSIVNVNSCIDLIKRLCGRISFIPLTLSLEPQIVEPPGIKKKTVHILQIRSDAKLAEIQKLGKVPPERIMLPALEEEEAPGDLFPAEAESKAGKERPAEPREEKTPDDIAEDDVADMDTVVRFCFHFWEMKPVEVCGQLGYKTMTDLKASRESPWAVWLTIKQLKQPPELEPEPEPTEEQAEQEVEDLWPEAGTGEVPPVEPEQTTATPEPEPEPVIDMDWLEKSLKTLQAKKLKAWSESNLLSYIKATYKVEAKTVLEAVAKLDKGAATHFVKRVEDTLQML